MDERDLKRLGSKLKDNNSSFQAALQQLSQDIAVRQKINDDNIEEMQRKVKQLTERNTEQIELLKDYKSVILKNKEDIDFLRGELKSMQEKTNQLQKRNEYLENYSVYILRQIFKYAEELKDSDIDKYRDVRVFLKSCLENFNQGFASSQHLPSVVSEILSLLQVASSETVISKPPEVPSSSQSNSKIDCSAENVLSDSMRTSTEEILQNTLNSSEINIKQDISFIQSVNNASIQEHSTKSTETSTSVEISSKKSDNLVSSEKSDQPTIISASDSKCSDSIIVSSKVDLVNTASKHLTIDLTEVVNDGLVDSSKDENDDQRLVYQHSEAHGATGSKSLRINIAPNSKEIVEKKEKPVHKSFSTSFTSLADQSYSNESQKFGKRMGKVSSAQSLNLLESLDELEWPDTSKLLGELDEIKVKTEGTSIQEQTMNTTDTVKEDLKKMEKESVSAEDVASESNNSKQTDKSDSQSEQVFRVALGAKNNRIECKSDGSGDRGCLTMNLDTSKNHSVSDSTEEAGAVQSSSTPPDDQQKFFPKVGVSDCGSSHGCDNSKRTHDSDYCQPGSMNCNSECEFEGCSSADNASKVKLNVVKNKPKLNKHKRKKKRKSKDSKETENSNEQEVSTGCMSETKSSEYLVSTSVIKDCSDSIEEKASAIKKIQESSPFSPEAKEFEPTREYGKAKLKLVPEKVEEPKHGGVAGCPKLINTR